MTDRSIGAGRAANDDDHDDFGGLARDRGMIDRRAMLGVFAGAGLTAVLAACTSGSSTKAASSGPTASTGTATAATTSTTATATDDAAKSNVDQIPEETAGPFPGDGSNGPDVLTLSGIVRSDIRSSFGSASGTADGVPLSLTVTIVDADGGQVPMPGAAVYVWHCDRAGNYSLYSDAAKDQNYLRGVQVADANGQVTYKTIFPAAYSGRWPHIHFEVYRTLADAMASKDPYRTSQVALPEVACKAVYATTGYEASVRNLAQTSLTRDMVFGDDGGVHQVAAMSGSVSAGYLASLTAPV